MPDLRDQCRWYGGDCGQGDKCNEECFEPIKAPSNIIFIQHSPLPGTPGTWSELRINDNDIEYVKVPAQKLTIEDIREIVCTYYKISSRQLGGKSYKRRFSHPRRIYAMLCRDFTDATYDEIGKSINRTIATVFNAKNTFMKYKTQEEYDQLRSRIERKENAYKLRQLYGGEHGEARDIKRGRRGRRPSCSQ